MKILCGFSFKRTYRVNHGLKMMKTLLYAVAECRVLSSIAKEKLPGNLRN